MQKTRDMTKGSCVNHIIAFALPLLFGNMFQQMYSLVDTAVVGKLVGVEALAAVGCAGWLDWLVLGFVLGLTQGFSISISQAFGAGDHSLMRRRVAQAGRLTACFIVVITALSTAMCGTVLRWMQTPEASYDMAHRYILTIFSGIPVTMCYNLFAGMLRAVGNSRTPLYAMILSSCCNVVLDLVCVALFDWGVVGAAAATVFSQLCSAVFCLTVILRTPMFRLSKEDRAPDRAIASHMVRLALPIAGQNTIVSVGGVVLQSIVNSFGVIMMAGMSAASKVSGVLEMCGQSISGAMHTYAGQNLGAGRYDRIREGVRKALIISVSIAILCGAVGILSGRYILRVFVDMNAANAAAVIEAGYRYLVVMCVMLSFLYSLFIFRSTLQGMGDAVHTLISSVLQVGMRSVVTLLLSRLLGETGVYFGDTLAWMAACLFLMVVYIRLIRRLTAVRPAPKAA